MKNAGRAYKDAIYEQFARVGKAVASPRRLELLDLLCQGGKTVETLAHEAGLTLANASRHLQILRAARLVDADKEGLYVKYRLADQMVCAFFRSMRVLAEHRLAEVDLIHRRFLEGKQGMEPVDRHRLLERVRRGEVTVLDVRPVDEYDAGHVSGAISLPLGALERHLSDLPRGQEIVAYCRGPYCVLSVTAVEMLRARGYNAVRIEEGIQDFRALGFTIAATEEESPSS